MLGVVLRRVAFSAFSLVVVSLLLFVLTRSIADSPARIVLGDQASEQQIAQFDRDHGLDRPIVVQYVTWISRLRAARRSRPIVHDRPRHEQADPQHAAGDNGDRRDRVSGRVDRVARPRDIVGVVARWADRLSRASGGCFRRVGPGLLARARPHSGADGGARLVSSGRIRAAVTGRFGAAPAIASRCRSSASASSIWRC